MSYGNVVAIGKKHFVPQSHLYLLVLKHFIDAGVKGRAREHGGDGIGKIQNCFKHRIHCLLNKELQGISRCLSDFCEKLNCHQI